MPKTRAYTEKDLQLALDSIKDGLPIRQAVKKFNIPRGTLQNHLHGRNKKTAKGPCPFVTVEEEMKISNWLVSCTEKGFPRRKQDIQAVVKDFLSKATRKTPFKNNTPGKTWYKSFLKRHPELALRTPEPITDASSKVSETDIRNWFAKIQMYLESKDYRKIIDDPKRVYNGDETNFVLCPKAGKVLAQRGVYFLLTLLAMIEIIKVCFPGSKNVYETDRGQAKENLTVMFSFSAAGYMVPPMIIYPLRRINQNIKDSFPDEFRIQKTDTGWMTSEVFLYYIENVFYADLKEKNIEFPVILFVDGHRTHLTYPLSKILVFYILFVF